VRLFYQKSIYLSIYLPCSEAGDAGEAAEVDDHIIDHGEQHATWST